MVCTLKKSFRELPRNHHGWVGKTLRIAREKACAQEQRLGVGPRECWEGIQGLSGAMET